MGEWQCEERHDRMQGWEQQRLIWGQSTWKEKGDEVECALIYSYSLREVLDCDIDVGKIEESRGAMHSIQDLLTWYHLDLDLYGTGWRQERKNDARWRVEKKREGAPRTITNIWDMCRTLTERKLKRECESGLVVSESFSFWHTMTKQNEKITSGSHFQFIRILNLHLY